MVLVMPLWPDTWLLERDATEAVAPAWSMQPRQLYIFVTNAAKADELDSRMYNATSTAVFGRNPRLLAAPGGCRG